jgi:lipid-A-disaccharide synthase
MKYYIIAGEASGDLHGSNLIKALKDKDPKAEIRCWGGDLMQTAGSTLVKHYKELAFMGFIEVLTNLSKISKNIKYCKKDIYNFNPHALIFIDYSGFNLRIAKWAKKHNLNTNYYISPQIWASRENRIHKIKRDIDAMYVILPFEKEFYEKRGFQVNFVGHPLLDAVANRAKVDETEFRTQNKLHPEKKIIALLPGSRKQEVEKMLSIMLSVIADFSEYEFVIAGAPGLENDFYASFLKNPNIGFVSNKTYDLLSISHAALVTSGTATLETAIFKVPQVVCYKANWISYQIAKRIISLDYISLVNLIMKKEVVKELIQGSLTSKNVKTELQKIVSGTARDEQITSYQELESKLGGPGASDKAAELIISNIR